MKTPAPFLILVFSASVTALAAESPTTSTNHPLEFIDTMGTLYERAAASRAAIESARARLRRRLASAAGLPTSTSDEQLAAVAAMRVGIDKERARDVLTAAADILRQGVTRSKDAVPVVADLQQLTALASAARGGKNKLREKGKGEGRILR